MARLNISTVFRISLAVCLLLSIVRAAPATRSLNTESTFFENIEDGHNGAMSTVDNFQRVPHRSNDALKNLFENSRTTLDIRNPIMATTPTLDGRENFEDYLKVETTKQSFDYDVSTTQYIGGPMSSRPTDGDESETTTYFIVKSEIPPSTTSTLLPPISPLSTKERSPGSSTITSAPTTSTTVPSKVIDFEYVEHASHIPSSYTESSFLSTLSLQGYETTIKPTDDEKIDSKSATTTTTIEARASPTPATEGALTESATTTTTGPITPPPPTTTATTSTPSPPAPAPLVVSKKYQTKINMNGGGSKGSSSISKKKSGITIMGHDGVKVTRKKQLLEKSYRDDAEATRKTNKIMEPIMATASVDATTMESVMTSEGGGIHVPSIDTFTENFRDVQKIMEPVTELFRRDSLKEEQDQNEAVTTVDPIVVAMVTEVDVRVVSSKGLSEPGTTITSTTNASSGAHYSENFEQKDTQAEISTALESDRNFSPSAGTIELSATTNQLTSVPSTVMPNQPKSTDVPTIKPAIPAELPSSQIQMEPTMASTKLDPDFLNETDIFVVEITSPDNHTDDVVNNEDPYNLNPIPKFTIHNDGISEYDSSNTRPYGGIEIDYESSKSQSDDDLFVPDLKMEPIEDLSPITVSAHGNLGGFNSRDTIDRDSDTIFYISNTEVKVVESKPTQNSGPTFGRQGHDSSDFGRSNLESQFYPAIYEEDVIIDFPAKNITYNVGRIGTDANGKPERYEEDIILSPLKNTFDPRTTYRNDAIQTSDWERIGHQQSNPIDFDNNMSLSYIGEKLIEVEPSQTESPITFPDPNPNSESVLEVNESLVPISDVIIQPANLPEMSIGVPVIGELPPQIELKEIDFMVAGGGGSSGANPGNLPSTFDGNNEKLDGILQYGGDLIAREGVMNSGYDIDTDYVFGGRQRGSNRDGNPANPIKTNRYKDPTNDFDLGRDVDVVGYEGNNGVTVASQIFMHAVDNLQKDQLMADVQGGFKDLPLKRAINANGTSAENSTNATAYSVMDESDGEFNFSDIQTLFLACFATLVPLILSVLLVFGLRYLWRKYRPGPSGGGMMGDNSTDPLATKSMTMSQDEDISRDARETKMHYTPSEKDGVFVVEVARGADSAGIPGSPHKNSEARPLNHTLDIDQMEKLPGNDLKSTNHEEVQIHQPPREGANDDETIIDVEDTNVSLKSEPPTNLGSTNTGLSQSDLSTSSADSNKGYAYGNQQLYTVDSKGYHSPSPKVNITSAKLSPSGKSEENDSHPGENDEIRAGGGSSGKSETKPIITAALLKQDTVIEINENCGTGHLFNCKDIEGCNGVEAKELIDIKLDIENTLQENNGDVVAENGNNKDPDIEHQDEQHQLGNGDIRPAADKIQQANGTLKGPENGSENGPENDDDGTTDAENGFDSIISLPAPPSSDEIKQFNDVLLMETNQLDSLPPPPPPVIEGQTMTSHDNANGHSIEGQNGMAVTVAITGTS